MSKSAAILRFGPFEANPRTGELRNGGIPIKLAAQAFQTLVLLAEHAGELVTREEIQRVLWPHDTVVEWEHGINTAVKRIRAALNDSRSEPRYIETLSRRGYRFIAAVERVPLPERVEQPASDLVVEAEAPASGSHPWVDPSGKVISHYRVSHVLGRGGMGVVYQAEDIRLGRPVALKFLAPGSDSDPNAVARFEREARMVSALSHPNICTIFEVDQFEGRPFLAMELLTGETLRDRIARSAPGSAVPLPVLLEVATAVADALESAHSQGVIHRDIKPANIFLTSAGGVKVLDFGLAKTGPRRLAQSDPSPAPNPLTSTGMALGTAAYMSPEQRRAEDLDSRTDLYSLGAVLYEAACGRIFADRNAGSGVVRHSDSHYPPRLWEIITRLVDADRQLRYQTAGDLASDLRRLRRDLSSGQASAAAVLAPVAASRRFQKRAALIVTAACLTVVAAGAVLVVWGRGKHVGVLTVQPLTGMSGYEEDPAFSPDGKMIAYSAHLETDGASHIYVKLIGGGPALELTSGSAEDLAPAWSPDSRSVAFLRHERDSGPGLCVVPALGGAGRRVANMEPLTPDGGTRAITWLSSGGIVISDRASPGDPHAIYEIMPETGAKRKLTDPPRDAPGDGTPESSPDGRMLAFLRWRGNSVSDIYVMPVTGGGARRLTVDGNRISSLAWTADGEGIVFHSRRGATPGLWKIAVGGGQPQPLSGIGGDAAEVAIARQGNLMAYVYQMQNYDLWWTAGPTATERRTKAEILTNSPRQDTSGEYSPDGKRIAFSSDRTGSFEIWTCGVDGSHPQQLTYFKGPITGTPHWSPDGRFIAFDSRPAGHGAVFVIGSDGGRPRQVTSDAFDDIVPNWSRDGQSIYFTSDRGKGSEIFRIPAGGGEVAQITHQGGFEAVESPDRAWLYYSKPGVGGIWRRPLGGGDEHRMVDRFVARFWTVSPFGLGFLDINAKPRPLLTLLDPSTRSVTQLGAFEGKVAWGSSGFSISPDGRRLLFAQQDRLVSYINVVENFR